MKASTLIILLASLCAFANAHGPEHLSEYGKFVKRANIAAASRCAASNVFSSSLREARMRKMKLAKRDWDPSYSTIQNTTCVLNPEVTEGPYWIAGELVRQNITDDEPGVPLLLDLGVLDVTTCQPIAGAYVEIWHCNSTGYYSGYTSASSSAPSGSGHSPLTDSLNFFRGAYKTNDNGLVEFATKVPGYYTGRTTHIHMKVTLNPTVNANGTITGGQTVHIGQMFFDAALKTSVFALSPYAGAHRDAEITNENDSIYNQEAGNGNNPIISTVSLGSSISDGFLGYLTIGVNSGFTADASTAPLYGSAISESSGSSSASGSQGTSTTTGAPGRPSSFSGSPPSRTGIPRAI